MSDNDINDFFSRYGSNQSTEEPKAETEGKKPSNVQARKITNAPSASVPTPTVPERPLGERDTRQIDQPALAQQAQAGLTQAGPPKAPSAIEAMSATAKDALPYATLPLLGWGAKALWDKFGKGGGGDGGPPPPPSGPTTKELIEAEKLKQAEMKTARDKILHENFLAKNTLTESEKLFGRKAKDVAELKLMDLAYEQQKGVAGAASPPASAPAAPVAPSAGPAPAPAPSAAPVAPAAAAPTALDLKNPAVTPTWGAPVTSTAPNQPAQVLATAETPVAVEQAVEKQEAAKPKAKKEPKAPPPEFFKNATPAERYMYGTFTKYKENPASAQAVVARAADFLPEGTKFEMQPGGEGGGLHPEQKPHFNKFVSQQLGVELKDGKLPEDFKWTTENRNKLASSVQTELEQHAKAGTLGKLGKGALAAAALLGITEAVQAAQKGDFGPLREAGFNIGGPITASAVGLTALSRAAGVPFSLATYSGGLNENEAKDLAYRQKVGTGRGIAPPSAYMR